MFYLLLIFTPLFAWLMPELGKAFPSFLRPLCVAGIFFCNGLQLDYKAFVDIRAHFKTALVIQFGSLIAIPLLAYILIITVFQWIGISDAYNSGILFAAMLPITTTSCVAFCQLAGVPINDALLNAVLGNVIGMFLLPLTVPLLVIGQGMISHTVMEDAFINIALTAALPLILGYFAHFFFSTPPALRLISQILLLYLIYNGYCESFSITSGINDSNMGILFWGMLIMHIAVTFLAFCFGYIFEFSSDTRTTMLLTIPQKTIVLGFPLAQAVFSGGQNQMTWVYFLLPLLFYNNIQYIAGGTIAWFNLFFKNKTE